MKKRIQAVIIQVLAIALVLGGIGSTPLTAKAAGKIAVGENYIQNPNFADSANLKVWAKAQGGATITTETAAEPVFGDVKTYGKITGRTSNYECFAQDVTNIVKPGTEYQYTFYVMLDAKDYADAPEAQRMVEISPYFTVNGSTTYSQGVSGTVSKALTPGEWTKFTGVYEPSWNGDATEVVIRLLEQGTNYGQGAGVMGTYYVTGVELKELVEDEEPFPIEYDVPDLKEAVADRLGKDFIVGGAVTGAEIQDQGVKALLTKHFNAVTIGNELKPDAIFNYSNNRCPGKETVTLNGESLEVPVVNFSRAEKILNTILKWNEQHPEDVIKVRGHVLVWHSQTPEWFFHEDYDASKPYVTPEVMNKRMEWYIKTVTQHFTGPDSKYKGMFYGWDVVNEAVSDGTGTYRNAAEKSSWWAVYESNEFIINAFRFANKYMDPEVELYYNDYNECNPTKRGGIVRLLSDVKNAEGTRIDGMGMQGHYNTTVDPNIENFEAAARAYAEVVGKVQLTEWDLKASSAYDGTVKTKDQEYSKQAFRYLDFYECIQKLADEGIFKGMTFWGNIDKYSWLQTKNSVGGAADGLSAQCPLLFDNSYMVKPAYWAFADASKIPPIIQRVDIKQQTDPESYSKGERLSMEGTNTTVRFIPMYNADGFTIKVTVEDLKKNDTDGITAYFSADGVNIEKKEVKRADATNLSGAYQTIINFPMDKELLKNDTTIYFDLVVTNDTTVVAFNDVNLEQDKKATNYAMGTLVESDEQPVSKGEVKDEDKKDTEDVMTDVEDETETPSNGGVRVTIGIGAAVVLVAAIVVVIILLSRRKKNSKKES